MSIVLFSGTTEGRLISRRLAEGGAAVTVCVATAYGTEEQGQTPGVTVLTGRTDASEMAQILAGAALCVDATHPYAVDASVNIQAACRAAGVEYRRLLRRESETAGAVTVDSGAEAAAYLAQTTGSILLTTGAKELGVYGALPPQRLYPRVLPSHESLSACEALGIPHRNILAIQGPFSREMNEAILRQYAIAYVVTKDGGAAGGCPEKAAAARATGANLVVIRRPKETGEDFETILQYCQEVLGCR